MPELGNVDRVRSQGAYHDHLTSDDSLSVARVDANASCVRLDRSGHSKHTRRRTRLAWPNSETSLFWLLTRTVRAGSSGQLMRRLVISAERPSLKFRGY